MDRKVIVLLALLVFIVIVTAVLLLSGASSDTRPQEVCGDGFCYAGENSFCPSDCELEKSVCEDLDCKDCRDGSGCERFDDECGRPFCLSNAYIAPQHDPTVACKIPIGENLLSGKHSYCECLGGECELILNKSAYCPKLCRYWRENDCRGMVANITQYWQEDCFEYDCSCIGEESLEERYFSETIPSCLEEHESHEDGFLECLRADDTGETYIEWCNKSGGTYDYLGLYPAPQCNLPTSDAGKGCDGNEDCESWCLVELTPGQMEILQQGQVITDFEGVCASREKVFGCLPEANEGVIRWEICID